MVINPGSKDSFDFGMPQLAERPSSEAMSGSMSLTVDDTFSFLNREPRRQRVDSDASSFYFRAPAPSQRGHLRGESTMSVASGPPISLYNRSFGVHRRNDSNASASSLANTYAAYGAYGGRAAWVKHRQDSSVNSALSDFSRMRLGRPSLGDKMLESGLEHGMPLTAISASPPESTKGDHRSSFDSILDEDRRSDAEDSLFDKTGHRSSVSSDSVFGYDDSRTAQGGCSLPQYRPLSMFSVQSVHHLANEDDTLISVSSPFVK